MHPADPTQDRRFRPLADGGGKGFDPRYLAAKKAIDDRALNHQVWERLRQSLPEPRGQRPVRLLEVGAGIGTMLTRVIDRGLVSGPASYLATDSDPDLLDAARDYLSNWAAGQGHRLGWQGPRRAELHTATCHLELELAPASIEELAGNPPPRPPFDLLIAHAVLDLVDYPALLPGLLALVQPRGLAYLSGNFDGETVFLPEGATDRQIVDRYHRSMDTRQPGASHTGRRLLALAPALNLEILAAGSSDWIIHPQLPYYSIEETFFLHAIIETVTRELSEDLSPAVLHPWAALRHQQVEDGELVFLARHLDLLARRLPSATL